MNTPCTDSRVIFQTFAEQVFSEASPWPATRAPASDQDSFHCHSPNLVSVAKVCISLSGSFDCRDPNANRLVAHAATSTRSVKTFVASLSLEHLVSSYFCCYRTYTYLPMAFNAWVTRLPPARLHPWMPPLPRPIRDQSTSSS